jgi:hypothetical protein
MNMLSERATGHIKKRGDRIAAFSPPLNLNLNYEKLRTKVTFLF